MNKKRSEFPPIKRINLRINHKKLLNCFSDFINNQDSINYVHGTEYLSDGYEQMTITKPSSIEYYHGKEDERCYDTILKKYKNTYVEEVLTKFQSPYTRVRLIVKKPGSYILPHIDYDTSFSMRYYIPLITNNWSFTAVQPKNQTPVIKNLKANGSIYFVNPGYLHSAWNFGKTDDVRLIVSVNGQEDV